MTILSVLPHGTWLDEILEFGLPLVALVLLVVLYFWSSRKPKEKRK